MGIDDTMNRTDAENPVHGVARRAAPDNAARPSITARAVAR